VYFYSAQVDEAGIMINDFTRAAIKMPRHLLYFTLPYFQGGQAVTPAQPWGSISLAQCLQMWRSLDSHSTTCEYSTTLQLFDIWRI